MGKVKTFLIFTAKFFGVLAVIGLLFFINHQYQLSREALLREPISDLVTVDGRQMSVYISNPSEPKQEADRRVKTLIFLSGAGTASPILDFITVAAELEEDFQIVIIERPGYGFSEDTDASRDIATLLNETRQVLKQIQVEGPYIVVAHSMAGLEAVYWAQQHPEEVAAIIGIDMSTPESYEQMAINMPLQYTLQATATLGITRVLPGFTQSSAINHGNLTDSEKATYKALLFTRTATAAMVNEMGDVKANAQAVADGHKISQPLLQLVSNGSEGTGFDKATWHAMQEKFDLAPNRCLVYIDQPHYLHNYASTEVAARIKQFIKQALPQ